MGMALLLFYIMVYSCPSVDYVKSVFRGLGVKTAQFEELFLLSAERAPIWHFICRVRAIWLFPGVREVIVTSRFNTDGAGVFTRNVYTVTNPFNWNHYLLLFRR
jgi:hypothetical protein